MRFVHCANPALQRNLRVRFQLGSSRVTTNSCYLYFLRGEVRHGEKPRVMLRDKLPPPPLPPSSRIFRLQGPGAVLGAAGAAQASRSACLPYLLPQRKLRCPTNIKQKEAPDTTFNTNNYPDQISLSPCPKLPNRSLLIVLLHFV